MIELTDEMRDSLASALDDKLPVTVCYVDADGQPQISFRGTAQVHSTDQLAIWARDPNGGLPNAVGIQHSGMSSPMRQSTSKLNCAIFYDGQYTALCITI